MIELLVTRLLTARARVPEGVSRSLLARISTPHFAETRAISFLQVPFTDPTNRLQQRRLQLRRPGSRLLLHHIHPPPDLHVPRAPLSKPHQRNPLPVAPPPRVLELRRRPLQPQDSPPVRLALEHVLRTYDLVGPRYPRRRVPAALLRLRRGHAPQERQQLVALRRVVRRALLGRARAAREELREQVQQVDLRREEDHRVLGGAPQERLRGREERGRVLDAVVGRGDEHLRGGRAPRDGQQVDVHLRGEARGDAHGRDPSGERDEAACPGRRVSTRHDESGRRRRDPFHEVDLVRMNLLPRLIPPLHGEVHQRAAPRGQQDARLLEALAQRAEPIRRPVLVPARGVRRGHLAVVERVQVAPREDVRRGKRRRRFDAVQQQDLVGRRQQQHRRAGAGLAPFGLAPPAALSGRG
ncbi:Uncharacterized protein TCAP_05709 [Tolypocladium capitatum]|uniref:Uncharacterized protein n=1 Tax=Tolypocladium capitatum TaxID=45235 RepID=A0A2K3Q9W3_9HYPO|nr:Uncharacterized protein TCAP_05709 [Tolypocladium capitatum]